MWIKKRHGESNKIRKNEENEKKASKNQPGAREKQSLCVCIFFYLSISGVRVAMMTMPLHSYTVYLWVCEFVIDLCVFLFSPQPTTYSTDTTMCTERKVSICAYACSGSLHTHTHVCEKKCVKMKSVNALLSASPLFETVVCVHNKHKKNQEKWATVAENNTKWFQQTKKLDFFYEYFFSLPLPSPLSLYVCVFASS